MNENMQRAALAGTRAAYVRCGGCGDARIRHPLTPGGQCSGVAYETASAYGKPGIPVPVRCPCTRLADDITEEE